MIETHISVSVPRILILNLDEELIEFKLMVREYIDYVNLFEILTQIIEHTLSNEYVIEEYPSLSRICGNRVYPHNEHVRKTITNAFNVLDKRLCNKFKAYGIDTDGNMQYYLCKIRYNDIVLRLLPY